MNRRQKMKRLKQELEWYKSQMVPVREVRYDSRQMRVETLRSEICINIDDTQYITGELIYKMLYKDLEKHLHNYIKHECYDQVRGGGFYKYISELKVVVPER